jgi:hypothetical protein
MLIVQFVDVSVPPYNAGEQAGLDDGLAYDLVAKGRALPVGWVAPGPNVGLEGVGLQAVQGASAGEEQLIQADHVEAAP